VAVLAFLQADGDEGGEDPTASDEERRLQELDREMEARRLWMQHGVPMSATMGGSTSACGDDSLDPLDLVPQPAHQVSKPPPLRPSVPGESYDVVDLSSTSLTSQLTQPSPRHSLSLSPVRTDGPPTQDEKGELSPSKLLSAITKLLAEHAHELPAAESQEEVKPPEPFPVDRSPSPVIKKVAKSPKRKGGVVGRVIRAGATKRGEAPTAVTLGYPCGKCSKVLKNRNQLVSHRRKEHCRVEKAYKCSEDGCGMSFVTNWNASQHYLRTHCAPIPDLICQQCPDQKFCLELDLALHIKVGFTFGTLRLYCSRWTVCAFNIPVLNAPKINQVTC
jgi:hypothetical protein